MKALVRYPAALAMPLLFHPDPHMFLGVGPSLSVSRDSFGDYKMTSVFFSPATFTVGGRL